MCDRQARPPSLVNCHSQNLVSEYKGGFFYNKIPTLDFKLLCGPLLPVAQNMFQGEWFL